MPNVFKKSKQILRKCEQPGVPAGIKRILILIVYTDRARTRLHPHLVAHWDPMGAGDFGPYLDLTLLTAGGRRGPSP
jgi:hypothetical protein